MQKYFSNNLNKLSFIIVLATILISFYIMVNGLGHIEGLDTGAGYYYYTDIPGWEKMFFGEDSIKLGTNYPILFYILFFGWGLLCYKFLKWLDQKK